MFLKEAMWTKTWQMEERSEGSPLNGMRPGKIGKPYR